MASYLEPHIGWDLLGDSNLIKRILYNISAYLVATCVDVAALLLTLEQAPTEDGLIIVEFEMRSVTRNRRRTTTLARDAPAPLTPLS